MVAGNMLEQVSETINFSQEEENILSFWKEKNIFQETLKRSKGKKKYSFYDGPPFATGLPHYGHILAGTIKDIVTRYAHQSGYHVERRFGWDCHGLPVEFEVDKALNIKGPDDVAKMGIAAYNDNCRKIVTRYVHEWETIVTRIGRWIDFKNDYKTLYPWYMESIWWVFSELWNKGLIYKGVKVMPFSTACNTPLSNFESGQNFKEVVDPAIIVTFPLVDEPETSLLAWTTTPWTLPSNLALCVNPSLDYVKVKGKQSKNNKASAKEEPPSNDKDSIGEKYYIVAESRLDFVFKTPDEYEIVDKFKGKQLKGRRYQPIFNYYKHISTAFVILNDTYVTEDAGTGAVHEAPYFGEDDYRVCLQAGVITRDQEIVCPVNSSGNFTSPVNDFLDQYVKDADKNIIKHLKIAGRLFNASNVKHNYPFCWRSDTPLIYKAVSSWFISVQPMTVDLMSCTRDTYWVPDFVKQKRFGNWLRDARDWSISRNRYWGTPIPLWSSEDGEEIVCVNSIAELEKLSGVLVNDLHRETVDNLVIPSVRVGMPPLKRVSEVFDCWFESGSMPYAQLHFPFENKVEFEEKFPADFIAEGIDQTRGWFYTLLVVSTALFNKPPFKNLIANGLILSADGQKMSKRKKNYPDPMEIVGKYGADALRLYLINSPVVRAENLRFKEEGVRDILKEVFLPWYNAYRFLVQNILQLRKEKEISFKFDGSVRTSNLMDKWILSYTQSLLKFVHQEMASYHLYTVVPQLVKFIDNLTNWYVRMNRRRFRGENGIEDCQQALASLTDVLYVMIRIMSPFTPFFSEFVYQNFRLLLNEHEQSIHYLMLPSPRVELIDEVIESAVRAMQIVIELGRTIRDRNALPLKLPLKEVVVIHNSATFLKNIDTLSHYIREELNLRKVTTSSDKQKYGVSLKAEPDHKVLGSRLKSSFKEVMSSIKALTHEQIQDFLKTGQLIINGHDIERGDLRIFSSFTGPAAVELSQKYESHSDNDALILLDITLDQSLQDEGIAREIINRVQKLRKKAHVLPTDRITVHYAVNPVDSDLGRIAKQYAEFISTAIKVPFLDTSPYLRVIQSDNQELRGSTLALMLAQESSSSSVEPNCRYVNVALNGMKPGYGTKIESGSILLENPVAENVLSYDQFVKQIGAVFGLHEHKYLLKIDSVVVLDKENFDINNLHKKTVFIEPYYCKKYVNPNPSISSPVCLQTEFLNVNYGSRKGCILMGTSLDGQDIINNDRFIADMANLIFDIGNKKTINLSYIDKTSVNVEVSS